MEPRIGGEKELPISKSDDANLSLQYWTTPFFERRGLAHSDAIRYGAIFAEHAVGRQDCGGIDHTLLKAMGIVLVGHRIKILKALADGLGGGPNVVGAAKDAQARAALTLRMAG